MLFGQKSCLPAYYRRIPGSISDVATLRTTMKSMDFLGSSSVHFVLDRGFYSKANIDDVLKRRHHLTMAVPSRGCDTMSLKYFVAIIGVAINKVSVHRYYPGC